jgi:hypothetical protein
LPLEKEGILSSFEIKSLFGNLSDMIETNAKFLADLETSKEEAASDGKKIHQIKIADILLDLVPNSLFVHLSPSIPFVHLYPTIPFVHIPTPPIPLRLISLVRCLNMKIIAPALTRQRRSYFI